MRCGTRRSRPGSALNPLAVTKLRSRGCTAPNTFPNRPTSSDGMQGNSNTRRPLNPRIDPQTDWQRRVLTEEFLKQAALASINNALSHHESATLLFQNGKAPAAAGLAIIGLEEFAKAVLFTIAAAVPEQRPILEARLKDLYEHNVKHVLTGMVDGAQEVNSEGWAVARDEGYPRSGEDMLADLFET